MANGASLGSGGGGRIGVIGVRVWLVACVRFDGHTFGTGGH
jgi:hypothetical protein